MADLSSIRKFLADTTIEDHGITFTLRRPSVAAIEKVKDYAGRGPEAHYSDRLLVGCVQQCIVYTDPEDQLTINEIFHTISTFGGLQSLLVRTCLEHCGLQSVVDSFDESTKQAEEMADLLKERTIAKLMGEPASADTSDQAGAAKRGPQPKEDPHNPFGQRIS